ncbi:MAG: hypothetical protein HYV09_20940 [Deltaproteobacteria bacterium]|nr:hypothetical protein [Deltaproteobacteria bacterium]
MLTRDVAYFGHQKNLRLDNGRVELILATEFGPRVLRYAMIGGSNVLGEVPPSVQGNDTPFGDEWHLYGGHRLWYAPEGDPRSYWPDNAPVRADIVRERVTLVQDVEPHTQLEKSITVELAPTGTKVSLTHTLTNRGAFEVELAPWALTVMARGGRAILAHPPYVPHPTALAPARPLVLWPYTRMADPRWTWGDRLIFLRHGAGDAQKLGVYDPEGFIAYELDGMLFVKRHEPRPGPHADFGTNVQTFTNELILELETLGPLARVPPGGAVVHREEWFLFDDVRLEGTEKECELALRNALSRCA